MADPKPTTVTHIRVTSKVDGFRRAGIAHSKSSQTIALKDLTKEQLQLLKDEPMLVVEELSAKDAK